MKPRSRRRSGRPPLLTGADYVELRIPPIRSGSKRPSAISHSDPAPRAVAARLRRIEMELARLPDIEAEGEAARPATRGECAGGPRPCPWVACRWHLSIPRGRAPTSLDVTCALDVADDGPSTLDEIASALGLTRERIRQFVARGGHLAEFQG